MYYFYRMAFTALQNIVSNYPDWSTDILKGYAIFILQEIPDSCPLVLEGSLKSLGHLLGHWRGLVTTGGQEEMPLCGWSLVHLILNSQVLTCYSERSKSIVRNFQEGESMFKKLYMTDH